MNLCLCGAQASYPHAEDCPRPLCRGSEADEQQWYRDRARPSAARVAADVVATLEVE